MRKGILFLLLFAPGCVTANFNVVHHVDRDTTAEISVELIK